MIKARWTARLAAALSLAVFHLAAVDAVLAQPAAATAPALQVPAQYATIQSAIDAAAAGATVQVAPGIYTEQLTINKALTIVGAGMDVTIVRAPYVLKRNMLRETSIVEVFSAVKVAMSQLTVAGPGYGTCKKGALFSGVRVHSLAHLDFRSGAVRDVHDSPLAPCGHSGTAVLVGDIGGAPASLNLDRSSITNYQSAGVVILGFGSTATITRNEVTGPGHAGGVATDGIEFPVGSVGTISGNVVSGNICPPSDASCGPDWFNQFQHAGIVAGGWGPGTVVEDNLVFGNQLGLFLGQSDRISNNRMVDNEFFGMGLFDGNFLIDGAQIKGGGGGVWVIAQGANTSVTLHDVSFAKLSGPSVQKLECCGFSASVTIAP